MQNFFGNCLLNCGPAESGFESINSQQQFENFTDLWLANYTPRIGFRGGLVKQIDRDEAIALEVMLSANEIREAVWNYESSKTPSNDRYNMNFIKQCWDEIGQEFTIVVMGKLPADANVTWVTLAPKYVGAKEIKDFRPISMVGCVYKVISKSQVEFYGFYVTEDGLRRRWRDWMTECVSTATMSVLVNRSPSKPFKMERGLRQGNPLSPLLFVLVVDVLHRMLGEQ
ncbi:uncharacterized protein LOC130939473 [Arachis stenosperma]|uniref:uncharacterized protein LOC130939473 n=1 Tax=Arachis stenosperma TaxID=217475 RepID=UPI0025AD1895|nr:uncharacterized protein LOC130939473 [Arachis stenosperma]